MTSDVVSVRETAFDVNVNCGIVTIRHAEGVVGVRDRLSYARAKDSDGTLE